MCFQWAHSLSPLSTCPHGEGCFSDRHKSGRLSCVTGEREVEGRERQGDYGDSESEEVKGVVRVELRQMSGMDEARSNTDAKLGCNKTSSSPQQSLARTAQPVCVGEYL